jgi:hypothetical protein
MNNSNLDLESRAKILPLENTARASRQDAELAMGNDPIRALVELITNSDDAYGEIEGKIVVDLRRGTDKWSIEVRDRASGMTQQDMANKLLRVAGRSSGFEEGKRVRGNLGRGAKDASIFGSATFESIKNNRYCKCEILRSQNYHFPVPDRVAAEEDRKRLGVPKGSGTVVTVTVTNGARCPQYATLKRDLASHIQLRDILLSSKRELYMRREDTLEQVTFVWPPREQILVHKVAIKAYADAAAELTIWRHTARDEGNPSSQFRLSGVLITGEKAIYENTFFSLESRANARWFSGVLRVPYIDTLARKYDDNDGGNPDPLNPVGIIRRDRGGLIHAHPFYEALQAEVEPILRELIDREDQKQRHVDSKISQQLAKDLADLGRTLGRMFAEDLEDTNEELPTHRGNETPAGKIEIIPAKIVAYLREPKTISVRVQEAVGASRVRINLVPDGLLTIRDTASLKLRDGKTTITLDPKAVGTGIMSIHAANDTQTADFEVREARPEPPPPPVRLEFEHELYTVKIGRPRKVKLIAPESVVLDHGDRVELSIKGTAIFRRGGQLRLEPNEDGIFECTVLLEAREQSGTVAIAAFVGSTQAKTVARVSESRESEGLAFQFSIESRIAGFHRALVEGSLVRIMGQHPAVSKLLGSPPTFPRQDEAVGRAAIAEIIAAEVTRKVLEAKFKNRELDAATLYYEHQQHFSRYLQKCQSALLPATIT